MAAGLGYKEFTTGDVLTAADANGYLASQVVMVFASAAARTSAIASPQEGMISYLKDTNSTEYYSGSAWVAIGGGGGSGKVLQVVQGTLTGNVSTTSTSLADTGLSVTITPSSATSKVLIMYHHVFSVARSSATNAGGTFTLLRGATDLQIPSNTYNIYINGASGTIELNTPISVHYLDSPATTSATTYKTQYKAESGTTMFASQTGRTQSIIAMEIGA
jgi:hypothetical protein